jgi:putative ABC transport system permease protein
LEKKGKALGNDFDKQIFMPISTLQEIQGRLGEVQGVWIRAQNSQLTKEVMSQAKNLFARNDLEIWDQEELLSKKDRISNVFKWALGTIALVSLLIGGIGIMNVLLVSVAERVKEIGIRKAVGASALDIIFQFIFESFLLTAIGAFLGVILGVGVGDYVIWVLNALIPSSGKWEAVFSWSSVGIALHFTFWVGFLFGIYPAWKAARLDPCEALTYS